MANKSYSSIYDLKKFIIDSVEELTEYIETESENRMSKYIENCNE